MMEIYTKCKVLYHHNGVKIMHPLFKDEIIGSYRNLRESMYLKIVLNRAKKKNRYCDTYCFVKFELIKDKFQPSLDIHGFLITRDFIENKKQETWQKNIR